MERAVEPTVAYHSVLSFKLLLHERQRFTVYMLEHKASMEITAPQSTVVRLGGSLKMVEVLGAGRCMGSKQLYHVNPTHLNVHHSVSLVHTVWIIRC